jgi:hypothetical protein
MFKAKFKYCVGTERISANSDLFSDDFEFNLIEIECEL